MLYGFCQTQKSSVAKQNMNKVQHCACQHLLRPGWSGAGISRAMQGHSSLSLLRRLWTAPLALQTPPRSASRANASKRAATGSWALRRNSTNAACVGETTRAARRSQACSPNPCKHWVATRASLSPSSAFWGVQGKAVGLVRSNLQVPMNVPVWRAEL